MRCSAMFCDVVRYAMLCRVVCCSFVSPRNYTVFLQKRTSIDFLEFGKHGSHMPSLQRLCFLRRSVAGLTYIRFGSKYDALIGPRVAEEIDNCRRNIKKTLKYLSGTVS